MLCRVYPRAAARVRIRQGNIRQAHSLAVSGGDVGLAQRLQEMRNLLLAPVERDVVLGRGSAMSGTFNQRVLQVFHSSITHDTNGYGVRSEQILQALAENTVSCRAMTRLGYPWDLIQHLSLSRDKPLSKSGPTTYHHSTHPSISLGHRESEYLGAYAEQICAQAQESNSSVIHAHSNYLNGLAARIAGDKLGLPVVYELRGLWHRTRALSQVGYGASEHYQFCEKQELRAALLADAVVVISAPLGRWLVGNGVSAEKISIVGNAAPVREPVDRCPDKTFVIGYVGSFVHYEGLMILLRAFEKVHQAYSHARLVLVGAGEQYKEVERWIENSELTAAIELVGRVRPDEVARYYARFDAAVVPRDSNPVTELVPPLKPMEIMAMGVPLIVSDVAPLREMVVAGSNAIVFRAGSASSLAECIQSLIDHPGLGDELRLAGLVHAKEHSWAENASLYREIYQQLRQPIRHD